MVLWLITLAAIITAISVAIFSWTDKAGIYISLAFFIISTGSLLYLTKESITTSKLMERFEDIIVGSIGVGLDTIKKLQDHPPAKIASTTSSRFQFIGVAGNKFLKDTFEKNDFFKTNKIESNVQIILMDPFANENDMLGLDGANTNIRKNIIKSIKYLNELRQKGYKFELRLYPRVPPLRLMICDGKAVAMSMYTPDVNGWQNAQLIFKKTSDESDTSLAPHFASLFLDMWDKSLSFSLEIRGNALEPLLSTNIRTTIVNTDRDIPNFGMVHGRFQPLHHEHLEYILWGINNSKKCIIGITQPNIDLLSTTEGEKHRMEESGNPFSYEERKMMITQSINDLGISKDRYEIIEFDVDKLDESIENIKNINGVISIEDVVQFMKIFSDWEKIKKSKFESKGCEVFEIHETTKEKAVKHVTGTLVRELIRSKRNWQDYTPSGTEVIVSKIENG